MPNLSTKFHQNPLNFFCSSAADKQIKNITSVFVSHWREKVTVSTEPIQKKLISSVIAYSVNAPIG